MDINTLREAYTRLPEPGLQPPDPWNKLDVRMYARGKHFYAVCIVDVQGVPCWQGYRLVTNIDGPVTARFWQKVPSNTSAEEKRFPRHLAAAGQQFLKEYKACKA